MKYTLIFVAFLLSCNSYYRMVGKGYKYRMLNDKMLYVMPVLFEEISVKCKDIVREKHENDNRDPQMIIHDSLNKYLQSMPGKKPGNITLVNDTVNLNEINRYDKNKICFRMPVKLGRNDSLFHFKVPYKKWLNKKGVNPDVVLSIHSVSIDYDEGDSPSKKWSEKEVSGSIDVACNLTTSGAAGYHCMKGFSPPSPPLAGPGGPMFFNNYYNNYESPKLVTYLKYIFFNYNKNEIIACGYEQIGTSVSRKGTFKNHYMDILRRVFYFSPFKLKDKKPKVKVKYMPK